jgi:2-oxoglutarate ferredoxin oxidoreductase subunit gamma
MAMGKVLALSAMREESPSHGCLLSAEVRGGTAHCMVVISDQAIASPYFEKADTLIILNDPSLKKFKSAIRPGGLLVVNASLAHCKGTSRRLRVANVPMTRPQPNWLIASPTPSGSALHRKKIISMATMESPLNRCWRTAKN